MKPATAILARLGAYALLLIFILLTGKTYAEPVTIHTNWNEPLNVTVWTSGQSDYAQVVIATGQPLTVDLPPGTCEVQIREADSGTSISNGTFTHSAGKHTYFSISQTSNSWTGIRGTSYLPVVEAALSEPEPITSTEFGATVALGAIAVCALGAYRSLNRIFNQAGE